MKVILTTLTLLGVAAAMFVYGITESSDPKFSPLVQQQNVVIPEVKVLPASVSSFFYGFDSSSTLEDISNSTSSTNPLWWLSSGGEFVVNGPTGSTLKGDLPIGSKWQKIYAAENPRDTDNGLHPQNIFRLVLKGSWSTYEQSVYFRIDKMNLSTSSFRNSSNGLMLFNRYEDSDNLYYAGLRVDGYVEIKKKQKGVYHTMAYKDFLHGPRYDRTKNPMVIPLNTWIGVKTIVSKTTIGSTYIRLYIELGTGWKLAAEAVDDGHTYGGPVITKPGNVGIRTDFMDVDIFGFSIKSA